MLTNTFNHVYSVNIFMLIYLYFAFTARSILINDSGLNDSTAPHIIVSVNDLCQDDKYTIYVQVGSRASANMNCVFQQNMNKINRGRVDVDFTLNGGQEYCYNVELTNVEGNTTATPSTCVYSSTVCLYVPVLRY